MTDSTKETIQDSDSGLRYECTRILDDNYIEFRIRPLFHLEFGGENLFDFMLDNQKPNLYEI